jgi:curved DNA-binding protein CbpA
MPSSEFQLADLKHAYQVLDVPLSSSTHLIKQAYRKLVKRWHPDRYAGGTPAHAEATQMTKLMNEAYSKIQNALLRYHIEANPLAQRNTGQTTETSASEPDSQATEKIPNTAQVEFWVRFVCGALFGVFVGLDFLWLNSSDSFKVLVLSIVAPTLGFGLASARYGDKFWHTVLWRWWLWP